MIPHQGPQGASATFATHTTDATGRVEEREGDKERDKTAFGAHTHARGIPPPPEPGPRHPRAQPLFFYDTHIHSLCIVIDTRRAEGLTCGLTLGGLTRLIIYVTTW